VENRPGANSNLATEALVRAPADGHTLSLVTAACAINATLYDKLNFNFIRDVAAVAEAILALMAERLSLSDIQAMLKKYAKRDLPRFYARLKQLAFDQTEPPAE
jgi:tripartite-type tricarboxylate transporter receptor subunit TctC